MSKVELDDRGRLLLPRDIRERYGEEFEIIEVLGDIVLIPVPKDPLATLQKEGEKIPKDLSVSDLKKIVRDAAMEQAMTRLKSHEDLGKTSSKKKR